MAGGRRHECPSRDSGKMEGVSRQKPTALRMIITRSPLRISLGGGGTDLPSYYRKHGGFLIAAAIDKYVYITVHRRFVDGFLLKYSHLEEVRSIDEIKHQIIREELKLAGIQERNLEIERMSDNLTGTGNGASVRFTTSL